MVTVCTYWIITLATCHDMEESPATFLLLLLLLLLLLCVTF
jgi:hypothetical protein